MVTVLLKLSFVLTFVVLTASQSQYCNICYDHTLCRYVGRSSSCRFAKESVPLTAAEKANIAHLHNVKRNMVAAGDETRGNPGPQFSAANMNVLVWDEELATIAQRWADQCTYGPDSCRNTKDGWVGQNVAMTYVSVNNPKPTDWEAAISTWYDEVKDFDRNDVRKFRFAPNIGHYSELVWANVAKVGCGYTKFDGGKPGFLSVLHVCNYGPGGNYEGQPVYKDGPPRSACKSPCVNSAYPALCVAP